MTQAIKLGGTFFVECWKTKKVKRSLFERLFTMLDPVKAFGVTKKGSKELRGWFPFIKWKRLKLSLKWKDKTHNLVTNVGLQHAIDTEFESGSQVTTWYVGLTNTSPSPAAGDTMASHAGWTENANYDESVRETYTSTRSNQTTSNSASKASFTIDTDSQTIGGAFICSDNTKSGSSGTLWCCAAFSGGDKSADDDDVINVQYDITFADDGS